LAILQFENLERASVSLLMLSVFNIFRMTRPLSGIEPWTSHTRSTLPLDYRGGIVNMITVHKDLHVT